MPISKVKKESIVSGLTEMLKDSTAIVAADNHGLTVDEMKELRVKASECGCIVRIAKNTLIKHALKDIGKLEGLESCLIGPTVLIAHADDPVSPAKTFVEFSKDHEKLTVKGALLNTEGMDVAGVEHLSKLPGMEELRAQFAGLINNLVGTVYFNANNLMGEFTGLVDAQKEKAA